MTYRTQCPQCGNQFPAFRYPAGRLEMTAPAVRPAFRPIMDRRAIGQLTTFTALGGMAVGIVNSVWLGTLTGRFLFGPVAIWAASGAICGLVYAAGLQEAAEMEAEEVPVTADNPPLPERATFAATGDGRSWQRIAATRAQLQAVGQAAELRPLTFRNWAGPGKPFTQPQFEAFLADMLARGLLERPIANRPPVLTEKGLIRFRRWATGLGVEFI